MIYKIEDNNNGFNTISIIKDYSHKIKYILWDILLQDFLQSGHYF